VVVHALREQSILFIVIVTRPFLFEGKCCLKIADEVIVSLAVNILIIIPNQRLLDVVGRDVYMIDAFVMINDVLSQSVCSSSDIITCLEHINVEFANVKTSMKDIGRAVIQSITAARVSYATKTTLQVIFSHFLKNMSIIGVREVLLNIIGDCNLGLHEISEVALIIYE